MSSICGLCRPDGATGSGLRAIFGRLDGCRRTPNCGEVLTAISSGRVSQAARLYTGPRGSANPAHPLRRQRDGAALKAVLGRIPAGDPVLAYLDLGKFAAEPRIRGRVPRERYTETLMALMLTEKLRHARQRRDPVL